MLTFKSIGRQGNVMSFFSDAIIKEEPMFFRSSIAYALKHGGPITEEFISKLDPEYLNGTIDSRVHMLMPGWNPCIPGWHHDDVPRSTKDGQPNYENPEYFSKHCMALVNADIAPTEFLIGDISVPKPEEGKVVYEQWDNYLNDNKQGKIVKAMDTLLYFDADTFHRGTAAVKRGWRWFGRVSINTNVKPKNEIRRQVQVYMPAINAGW